MKSETIYANYCERGMTLVLADVAKSSDFTELRKIEKEFAECLKDKLVEQNETAGRPVSVSRVTVRGDKKNQCDDSIPRAAFITFAAKQEQARSVTTSITFSSIGDTFKSHVPAYHRAVARYENGVDIDGERVYRELVDGTVWSVAQEVPIPPSYTGSVLAVKELSDRWETAVKVVIDRLQLRLDLQNGLKDSTPNVIGGELKSISLLNFHDNGEGAKDSERSSLVPEQAINGIRYGSLHGTKGEVFCGAGWQAWRIKSWNSDFDQWSKHFVGDAVASG